MTNEERAALVERIAELKVALDYRTADGLHTCYGGCNLVTCTLRRRIEILEAVIEDLLTRFDAWSPHDHIAADRARKALGEAE